MPDQRLILVESDDVLLRKLGDSSAFGLGFAFRCVGSACREFCKDSFNGICRNDVVFCRNEIVALIQQHCEEAERLAWPTGPAVRHPAKLFGLPIPTRPGNGLMDACSHTRRMRE